MTWLWGLLAAAALAWPDRVAGPLDGLPLDRTLEAVAIGLAFPMLWWFHPRFLKSRIARTLVAALLAWKVFGVATFRPEGWCVRFEPQRPYVNDQTGAPHAWDIRADWRSADPSCSAVMTRSYGSFAEFPAWFFNLPPPGDSWPGEKDRPPGASTRLRVSGFLSTRDPGTLRLDVSEDIGYTLSLDGGPATPEATLNPGTHLIVVDATLTGDRWHVIPTWNGRDLWSANTHAIATLGRPSALDLRLRPWVRPIPAALAAALLLIWFAAALRRVGDVRIVAWSSVASAALAWLVIRDRMDVASWGVAGLVLCAAIPVRESRRTWRGAFMMVGVPWLVFVATAAAPAVGRYVLYDWGNDYWMFQRFAYRIVMQGYWLEGGSATFWFQPLYRWIAGALHLVFGDSSVGEWFWDGACLLAGSLFSFEIARAFAGFRWGLAAAVVPLAVFVLGTPQYLIGRGLGEITSAGFLSAAALFAWRSRSGHTRSAWLAGLLAVLGFYTRLNNLLMAAAVAVFAAPDRATDRAAWRSSAIIVGVVAAGVVLFACRTWYYTGIFSVFYGTQRELLAIWQPGLPLQRVLERALASVAMVLSVNDPPRFDPYALPVLAGAAAAVCAVARVPRLRDLPGRPVAFFFAAIAGAFIARGSAYPGRFSLHVIPIASALAVCAAASLVRQRHTSAL